MQDIKGLLSNIITATLFCLCGCSGHKDVNAKNYVKYILNEDNGMLQAKSIEEIKYEVQYLTPEAMTLLELKDSANQENYNAVLSQYQGMHYVRMSIKADKMRHVYNAVRENGNDPEMIEQYLNLAAQKDFMLISGRDTSVCGLYSFSKTYGLAYDWQILMGFEKKDTLHDLYVKYEDKIGNNGGLFFQFSRADIKKTPTINFSL